MLRADLQALSTGRVPLASQVILRRRMREKLFIIVESCLDVLIDVAFGRIRFVRFLINGNSADDCSAPLLGLISVPIVKNIIRFVA